MSGKEGAEWEPRTTTEEQSHFPASSNFDKNLAEFERCVIRSESVGYGRREEENDVAELFEESNAAIVEGNTFSIPTSDPFAGASTFDVPGMADEYPDAAQYYPSTAPPADPYNNGHVEVNFSEVFDTGNSGNYHQHQQHNVDHHHFHRPDSTNFIKDSNNLVIDLDKEFTVTSSAPGGGAYSGGRKKSERRGSKDRRGSNGNNEHGNPDKIRFQGESKLSMLSDDGNVLHSPASRHLISQFERFLVKEFIIKRSPAGSHNNPNTNYERPSTAPELERVSDQKPEQGLKRASGTDYVPNDRNKGDPDVSLSRDLYYEPSEQHTAAFCNDAAHAKESAPATEQQADEVTARTVRFEVKSNASIGEAQESERKEESVKPAAKLIPEAIVAASLLSVWRYQPDERNELDPSGTNGAASVQSVTSAIKKKEEPTERPRLVSAGKVPCRYSFSGCKEMLERGSMYEQDHYQSCKYRPLDCLLSPVCRETLPYHNYIPHLMQHFMVPTYDTQVTTTVILTPEDFSRNQTWTPKWLSAYKQHFFAILSRKNGDDSVTDTGGIWTSWVWMLGTPAEADHYAARITLFKGLKEVSQLIPVHSVRTKLEEIEEERMCLFLNDSTVRELTQIGSNILADFSLRVQLISNAKELNNTTRELQALSASKPKPLRSEKLYVTTVDATESDDEET